MDPGHPNQTIWPTLTAKWQAGAVARRLGSGSCDPADATETSCKGIPSVIGTASSAVLAAPCSRGAECQDQGYCIDRGGGPVRSIRGEQARLVDAVPAHTAGRRPWCNQAGAESWCVGEDAA